MADFRYLSQNRVGTVKVSWNRRTQRNTLIVGLPLVIIAAGFNYILAAAVFAAVVMYSLAKDRDPVYSTSQPEGAIAEAGAEGERIALAALKGLPDDFTVFNNVYLQSDKSSTGFREGDLVVVGPNAVFVLEVKHNKGEITCDESLASWPVRKVGRGGKVYHDEMRNPVGQVKSYVYLLAGHLRNRRTHLWVQGLVVFTHPETTLYAPRNPSVPILRPKQATHYLVDFPYQGGRREVAGARRELIRLVQNPLIKASAS